MSRLIKDCIFLRLKDTHGINRHQEWIARFDDGEEVQVSSNEDTDDPKWHTGNGEGCDTKWFHTKQEAVLFQAAKNCINNMRR